MIADKLQSILDSKEQIKIAIENKGVTVGDVPFSQYADKITEISAGGLQEAEEKDVNFYDYDGFRVASYTITEAKALTQAEYDAIRPPTHNGLTFQEWNWSLNDITTYNRKYADIGANYVTTDGWTHIKVKIDDVSTQFFTMQLYMKPQMTINVDYGNGVSANLSTTTSSENKGITYKYPQPGTYDVKFTITSNPNNNTYGFRAMNAFKYQSLAIKEINFGNNVSMESNNSLTYLKSNISFPTSFRVSGESALCGTESPTIVMPRGQVTYNINYFFYNVHSRRLCLPKNCTGTLLSTANFSGLNTSRLVLPKPTTTVTFPTNQCYSMHAVTVLSIPAEVSFASTNISVNLRYLDVEQGWVPTCDMTFSNDGMVTSNVIEVFDKLGTTSTTRTLTFGSTILDRLTAAQKAVATNKGYTLA